MKRFVWPVLLCLLLCLTACRGAAPADPGIAAGEPDTAASLPAETEEQPGSADTAAEPEESSLPDETEPAPADEEMEEPAEDEGSAPGSAPEDEPEPTEEEAEIVESEPEIREDEADYAALAGIWFGEHSTEVLTVYENGGFLLQTDAVCAYGYLKYTEEEGGLWDPVPRYEMYLENNERLYGNTALSLDEQYPGTLTYTEGAGAMLFRPEVPGWSTEDGLVQARYASGVWTDCTTAEISGEEPTVEVLFTAAGEVEDFRILSLHLKDVDQEGNPEFLVKDEYRQETLPMGWPVLAKLTFYGDIPNNGISYRGEDGKMRYYALGMSGEDGSLLLWEF